MSFRSLHTVANEYTSEFVLSICLLFNPTLLGAWSKRIYHSYICELLIRHNWHCVTFIKQFKYTLIWIIEAFVYLILDSEYSGLR